MAVKKNPHNGNWYCSFRYTDWKGNKKRKKKEGFKTKKEALKYENDFLAKTKANPDMKFKHLVSLYLEDSKTRLKPTTLDNKKYLIETKLSPYFENLSLQDITVATVRKWQNELISDPKKFSPTYLKTIHNQLSAIFNFAKKYYGLRDNPAAICGSMGKKNAESMQFWTHDEFKQFIKSVSDKPASKAAFNILFYTGIRLGELLALTLDDFDFENNSLTINKNYARLNSEDLILEPKTPKSKRVIKIPEFLCDIVTEYANALYDYQSNERLFEFTKYFLHHEMKRGSKKSGVKKIRVHDLRHSHASMLIELSFTPLIISERLGHENIQTTLQTYSHLYPNKHEEVAKKLQEINLI